MGVRVTYSPFCQPPAFARFLEHFEEAFNALPVEGEEPDGGDSSAE